MTLESSSQVAPGAAAGVNYVEGERLCGVCLCGIFSLLTSELDSAKVVALSWPRRVRCNTYA